MTIKKLLTLGVISLVSACAVGSEGGVLKTEERSGGFLGLSTNSAIEVETADAFKGKQKVIIGGFKVGFNDSKKLQNKASGGLLGGGFGGKSTGLVKLEGIDEATKQAITDVAYEDFIKKLQDKGYEVAPSSTYTSSSAYADAKKYAFPYENDTSGFLSSYGTSKYYSPAKIGNSQPIYIGEIPEVTGGFAFGNGTTAASKFAEESKIPVLYVTYFVDFAGKSGHEGMTTSSIKVGQVLSVDQGTLGIIGGYGGTFSSNIGSMKLGQPIGSTKEFATIENVTSDAAASLETVANIFSAVSGGGTNHSREFVYHADAEKYKAASSDVLVKANDAFINKMSSLK